MEIREPGRPVRRLSVDALIVVGRDGEGVIVDDPEVSRRHLSLDPGPAGITVTDLGSRNGTTINGLALTGPALLAPGDRIGLGAVEIAVIDVASDVPSDVPSGDSATLDPPTLDAPTVAAPRPRLEELRARTVDGAVLRFRPGTAGERAVPGMAIAIRRAGRRLAGLGPDLKALVPQICLVDPFPDPSSPGVTVTAGSVVDAGRREVWMAVTSEAPPEPPERPLALLLGASLPAGPDLALLLEGYGLMVAELPSPDDYLRDLDLESLEDAEGEIRTAMAQSFVTFLVKRAGRDDFLRMLSTAQPGGLDAAAQDVLGQGMAALEAAWAQSLRSPPPKIKAGRFLRLTLRYLRPHLRRELETFVYMLFALAFTVVFPFVMKRLLDSAIPHHSIGESLRLVGLLGLALMVSLLASLRQTYLSSYVSSAITRDVRVDMFSRLQSLSAGWFGRQQEGDILSRLFSDVSQMEQGVSQTIREGIFQLISVIVSAVVLLKLNLLLGLIVVVGAPLVGIVYRVMASGAQKRSLAVQEELGTAYTVASENYGAQAVVKAFGLEQREQDRFKRASERLFGREVKLQLFGGVFGLSVNTIVTVLQLVILGLGTWLILHGRLTIGGMVAFSSTMGQVLSPVTVLTGVGQRIQAASGSLVRINEVIDATLDIDDGKEVTDLAPLQRDIHLDRVGFSYTPERRTLEAIDCVIPAGSRVAFVGPTGAGKSSVLQLLMRFYDVDEGAVRFDGQDVREATLSSLRNQLGVVFQETFLFDTTIRENIAMGKPDATDAEIESAARAAELHEFVQTLPRGYNTLVGERGGRLSGGQRQRLAIARAVLRDPRVLLLDEATSALDPRTERMISDTLQRVGRGRTTIAVTHRLTSITSYDRIFVLESGRLEDQGTHAELLAREGVYAQLWAEQTGGVVAVETPFDAIKALSAVHIFFGLSSQELAAAAVRLRAMELRAGERIADDMGTLTIVRRGRPRVLSPGLDGRAVPVAELQPGDAFGVSALLGQETGSVLVADEPVSLLVLDADSLAALAAIHPSLATSLSGASRPGVAPSGGQRLSRVSLALRPSRGPIRAEPTTEGPGPDDVRRMSGTFRGVQQ